MSPQFPLARRAVLLALLGGLVACASDAVHPYLHDVEQPHPAEWGYTGAIGPDHWGDLSPDYVHAKTGRAQSPIDIRGAVPRDLPPIAFDYDTVAIDLVYNGHTIEEHEDRTSSIEVGGKRYVLEQFHFHSPSEHTVDGRHSAMEMHLVHKSEDGALAVVAVLIEEGAENAAFARVWDYLPTAENRSRTAQATVDTGALLPVDRSYYRYSGSFTTPPCLEGISWMVLLSPVELSAAQIDRFRAVIDGNNRPVQALNDREIAVSR
jgi:carbonic anhydrase